MFPQLFHLGKFFLPTYGFLVSLGVLIGLWVSVRNSERLGIDADKSWNLGILVVLCGIIGAKVLYVVNEWSYYTDSSQRDSQCQRRCRRAEFSLEACWPRSWPPPCMSGSITCRLWELAMPSPPASPWDTAIGRIGCFAAGCCYGKETHHWWGVTFTNPLAASITGTPLGKPLEPTQLFESAVELANFFFLMWLLKRRTFDGQIIGAFMFIYGVARFFLEYLRDDPGRGSVFGGAMTGTQLIAIGLVLAGGFIWWLRPGSKPVTAPAVGATR